ncbi:MlaD family protein [Nocardia sp. NPDC058379]|uniref:MlaD family protein n=1 Tax=unclassified Nocardia TaxID=2637762 RepID=UPI003663138E
MKLKSVVSLGAIIVLFVAGVLYMTVGVLEINPFAKYTNIRMTLPTSGGLAVDSPILLTGVEVGSVTEVRKAATGVEVHLRIRDEYRIPVSSAVKIEALSSLGEPYVEFTPIDDRGPYLRNGERVDTRTITPPVSIPQMSARIVAVVEQLDPAAISSLVDTADRAVRGTESELPGLERATRLLAATILSRTASIHQLLLDLQTIGGDTAWAGPAFHDSGPEWVALGGRLEEAIGEAAELSGKRDPNDYLTGDGVVPFLGRLNELMADLGPSMQAAVPLLQTLSAHGSTALSRVDISSLIVQALGTVGDDGVVHLRLQVK